MGFEAQDLSNVNYGQLHVPSIALREIPIQREQLRLKLFYGSRKVTSFNADLTTKQVSALNLLHIYVVENKLLIEKMFIDCCTS